MAEKKPTVVEKNKCTSKYKRGVSVSQNKTKKEVCSSEPTGVKPIDDLKNLYGEIVKVDVELQLATYAVEKEFQKQYDELYEQRFKILEDFKKESAGQESELNLFWLKVLQSSYKDFITKEDEKILKHLIDIRIKVFNEQPVKFILEFYFEKNEFFSNTVLTKTYYIQTMPDKDDLLNFDGAEIHKCEGCTIDWTVDQSKGMNDYSSFFDFFKPPVLPEDSNDPNFDDINGFLQNDFEVGSYLKERVVPKAIMFFTGEIEDCSESDKNGGAGDGLTGNVTPDTGNN